MDDRDFQDENSENIKAYREWYGIGNLEMISKNIRQVDDFPIAGINFLDWLPIMNKWQEFSSIISAMTGIIDRIAKNDYSLLAIESRGFLLGAPLSMRLGKNLLVARKPGKLPEPTITENQTTEYGSSTLSISRDKLKDKKIIVIDDVIATGGTLECVKSLIEKENGIFLGIAGLIDLPYCKKDNSLDKYIHTVYTRKTPESTIEVVR